jgi:hypothetical protein
MSDENLVLADLAIEFWKALRAHERTLQHVPILQLPKVEAQIRFSTSRLDFLLQQTGLSLVLFSGTYTPNLPATAMNGDEFSGTNETLLIERTVEPAIVHQEGMRVVRMGKVWLQKGSPNVSRD